MFRSSISTLSHSHKVIATLHEAYGKVRATSGLRALFLRANGKFFCAGADLKWMQRTADYTPEQNKEDAYKLGQCAACRTVGAGFERAVFKESELEKKKTLTVATARGPGAATPYHHCKTLFIFSKLTFG
jgi:hypothetical protein